MPFDGAGFVPGESLRKLDAIIDLVGVPERWGKGSFRTHDGRYCLRGAIREVDATEAVGSVILAAINEVTGRHYWRIESFNDHSRTDHDQIVAVLSRARDNVAAGRVVTTATGAVRRSRLSRWWNKMSFSLAK